MNKMQKYIKHIHFILLFMQLSNICMAKDSRNILLYLLIDILVKCV